MKTPASHKGFTLIELMITIAIISILAAVIIPSYRTYVRRAYYSEVILAAEPFKAAVGVCYQKLNTLVGCSGGTNGVPPNVTTPFGAVSQITVTNGVITVTPAALHGILATDTYILTPTMTQPQMLWAPSGGGVVNGYAQ